MTGDGTDLREIFRYADFRGSCPCISPYVDITRDGSKVLWTDRIGQIFVANSDGTDRIEVAVSFPTPAGSQNPTIGPNIPASPKFTADGSKIFFPNLVPGASRGDGMAWGAIAGVWSVNVDGSNQTQVFSYIDMASAVFGTTGAEYNPGSAFGGFGINANGFHMVMTTTTESGGVDTWANGTFRYLHNSQILTSAQVVITRDGSRIAYNDSDEHTVVSDRVEVGDRKVLTQLDGLESARLGISSDGSVVSFDPSGTESSPSVTLVQTGSGERLDLAPLKEPGLCGRRRKDSHLLDKISIT
ncbi:MAG: hypothetical protein ACI8T1_005023 [Verrucomicrobiales bacterium]|jgi:hypothetical protein